MKNIEHIAVAVKDLDVSIPLFEKLLGTSCYKKETVNSENVITAFFKTGNVKIELLQDEKEGGIIDKFISKKGEGLHHIAFEVNDIIAEAEKLKEQGFLLLNEVPKRGADDKLITFLHPKSVNGVLIELCQQIIPHINL
jgi:methylmalonyl-CoA/ethylmalonyl-CoA epimerase